MKLPNRTEVRKIVDAHKQLRLNSCFQSAPELWPKVKGVIRPSEYPEQEIPQHDGRGYEPYPNGGIKVYGRKRVHFEKITFHHPYNGMKERFRAELGKGNPVVISLPSGPQHWHGYLVTEFDGNEFVVFSKTSPPNSLTIETHLSGLLGINPKVDCLFMSRPKDV